MPHHRKRPRHKSERHLLPRSRVQVPVETQGIKQPRSSVTGGRVRSRERSVRRGGTSLALRFPAGGKCAVLSPISQALPPLWTCKATDMFIITTRTQQASTAANYHIAVPKGVPPLLEFGISLQPSSALRLATILKEKVKVGIDKEL
eukprot:185154-Hanusia_phi.AAC.9